MEQIKIESAGVLGQICSSRETVRKVLEDDFTYHYLPEAKIDSFPGKIGPLILPCISFIVVGSNVSK